VLDRSMVLHSISKYAAATSPWSKGSTSSTPGTVGAAESPGTKNGPTAWLSRSRYSLFTERLNHVQDPLRDSGQSIGLILRKSLSSLCFNLIDERLQVVLRLCFFTS
jgi:hypothetical protein